MADTNQIGPRRLHFGLDLMRAKQHERQRALVEVGQWGALSTGEPRSALRAGANLNVGRYKEWHRQDSVRGRQKGNASVPTCQASPVTLDCLL